MPRRQATRTAAASQPTNPPHALLAAPRCCWRCSPCCRCCRRCCSWPSSCAPPRRRSPCSTSCSSRASSAPATRGCSSWPRSSRVRARGIAPGGMRRGVAGLMPAPSLEMGSGFFGGRSYTALCLVQCSFSRSLQFRDKAYIERMRGGLCQDRISRGAGTRVWQPSIRDQLQLRQGGGTKRMWLVCRRRPSSGVPVHGGPWRLH